MTTGRMEFSRFFWSAYGHILQLLWRLKWPIVVLAVAGIIFWLIKR